MSDWLKFMWCIFTHKKHHYRQMIMVQPYPARLVTLCKVCDGELKGGEE